MASNKTDSLIVDTECVKVETEVATGTDVIDVTVTSVKIGSNACDASEVTAVWTLLLKLCDIDWS